MKDGDNYAFGHMLLDTCVTYHYSIQINLCSSLGLDRVPPI